ncbi:CPBP family intramembrane metalloprotease [Staphylococcus saccharolyticus]|uniref:CPBP family intramembrane glutamic endopeptidase n=1 Tax=Staphylococcus saccharolyticus TaxID=33028 RepID=UPI00102D8AFA|nr:type II CAAX endopeptidase family protein [Staphylococcus saccharolyticus]MBL7573607.1 CPBP family intramembrane metalloprotease [Staphylococcus saccharolyticus]MBL7584602.1 CPBP family intramembrane metalloprotease [Staphylococcus saccharolyticus]MBL7639463.1 CPBP family intramembrane metalloprotease [Staphylococcus saccharolyticus]QRJ68778.1 CPBP family intramembrane metalloprotease [Staphylococcus saccharolyticus]TAA92099.1 CPBP family intramembrane metalloprotease [Staphylococcus saccha
MSENKIIKKYRFRDIAWRDLNLIAIGMISLYVLSFVGLAIASCIYGEISSLQLAMISTLGQLMAYVIVIFAFYFLHIITFVNRVKNGWLYVKNHWLFLIIVFLVTIILSNVYDQLMQFLPKHLQYSDTQNEMELDKLFENHAFIPFAFLLIVIVGPIVEELVFRHIIIGELGKKFNFVLMGIVSAVLFTLIHVTDAKSPFEFGAYLILAISLVYVYLKSDRKLAASLSLHMLNNLISFIWTIIVIF